MTNGANPNDHIQYLQNELQDAHLVIGRQQVALLRLEQVLQQTQQRLAVLEAAAEADAIPAEKLADGR